MAWELAQALLIEGMDIPANQKITELSLCFYDFHNKNPSKNMSFPHRDQSWRLQLSLAFDLYISTSGQNSVLNPANLVGLFNHVGNKNSNSN